MTKTDKSIQNIDKKRINRTIRIGILRNENVHVYRTMQRFVWIEKNHLKRCGMNGAKLTAIWCC